MGKVKRYLSTTNLYGCDFIIIIALSKFQKEHKFSIFIAISNLHNFIQDHYRNIQIGPERFPFIRNIEPP